MYLIKESILEIPSIPNTMNFYHGGNLDDYDDSIAQKNGRYEYGPGLYLITHYETARKYAKGSRKLYLVTVKTGVELSTAKLGVESVYDFVDSYVIGSKKKEVKQRLEKYIKSDKISASVFSNVLLNEQAIKSTNTKYLRNFLIENGIDYEIVNNPFGWHEVMMVLYNMKKIVKIIQIKSTDTIEHYDLKV